MKRNVKLILFLLVTIITLMLLCSCSLIDELKEQRVDSLDEEMTLLEYKGKRYRLLENRSERNLNTEDALVCYVVEEDVPLLLIEDFGYQGEYLPEQELIACNGKYYTTEEKYEKYEKLLSEGKIDRYRSYKWSMDEERGVYREYFVLDPKTVDLIEGTKVTVMGQELKYYDYEWEDMWLDGCDSTGLLIEYNSVRLYHDVENDKYGIILTDDGDVSIIKEFPESGKELIKDLFTKSQYSSGYYQEWTEEYEDF